MLNIGFAFEDAVDSLDHYSNALEIYSLPPAVFLMQRDVINHYRHSLTHYFSISLEEPYLQNSSHGSPYQKWAFVVNENFDLLSLLILQLLRYTSRLVHETKIKTLLSKSQYEASSISSNCYTNPICEIKFKNKPIGIHVQADERLQVTWIRAEPRPERTVLRQSGNEPQHYFLVGVETDGHKVRTPISKEEYELYTESVSRTDYNIGDRSTLIDIQTQGLKEISHLETLCRRFAISCNKFCRERDIATEFSNLNEEYWT
jgi:hypothetical protein